MRVAKAWVLMHENVPAHWLLVVQQQLNTHITVVRFQVLMVASMKITAFWDIAPCSLIEVD
jgi:hypothetical protein